MMTTHSKLFSQIEDLLKPFERGGLDGWTTPLRGCEYAAIIMATRPSVTVELGTWCGRGAFAMALAHRFVGYGKVHVVDPWKGEASAVGMEGENAKWWGDQTKHEYAFESYNLTGARLELGLWINTHRMTSDEAPVPESIGLLIIDGNHGPQAIKDVERWAPSVSRAGYVFLDDLNWSTGHVATASERLIAMGFKQAWGRDEGGFYVRTK